MRLTIRRFLRWKASHPKRDMPAKTRDRIDPFLGAIYRKNYKEISSLLAQGVDVNLLDADGRTGLMHAVLDSDADAQMVQFLVKAGANVHWHDGGQKWTALHFAARDNKYEIVKTLIQAGAEIDAVDSFGNTPLWRATMECRGDYSVIRLLLNNGADPSRKNNSGNSPIDLAYTKGAKELSEILQA